MAGDYTEQTCLCGTVTKPTEDVVGRHVPVCGAVQPPREGARLRRWSDSGTAVLCDFSMGARRKDLTPWEGSGFTLLELLVVISLLVLLAGIAWPLLGSERPKERLERSAQRLTSLLAMCQAEAMLNGRPFRLTWPDDIDSQEASWLQPVVEHEADPIGSPGEFQAVAAAWAHEPVLLSDVQCRLVQLGPIDLPELASSGGRFEVPDEPSLVPIQFYPDGTTDDAVFVLTVVTEDQEQEELQLWVVLDGASGMASIQWPPDEEAFEELLEQQASLLDLKFDEHEVTTGIVTAEEQAEESELSSSGDLVGTLSGLIGDSGADVGEGLQSSDLRSLLQSLLEMLRRGDFEGVDTMGLQTALEEILGDQR